MAFRIHGDNIVECERITNIIIDAVTNPTINTSLISPSTVKYTIDASFNGREIHFELELLPGFNKNTKKRWEQNIFDALKSAGSFFDETPDAIIAEVDKNNNEHILLGIEFCSALQAGNQAWQRSARAFSTGRTGCPYIYIVDFVKYELDNETRARKNLRFPNAAVPYSYVNYSKNLNSFIAQLYTKSEEFDKSKDDSIKDFDENDFGNADLGQYLVKLLIGEDTSAEEHAILDKNMNVVQFLANHFDSSTNYTIDEWNDVYNLVKEDIVDYAVDNKRFEFHKTIAAKSHHGQSEQFVKLVDDLSTGLASRDLPFGIIPAHLRPEFANRLSKLYPSADAAIIQSISNKKNHLIVAIFKGFKPRGDDNRPDRGLLPLAAMLSASDVEVMSFIYGPMIKANLDLLESDQIQLANRNGLWRSILALSNYVVLDVPVIAKKRIDVEKIYDTSATKSYFTKLGDGTALEARESFSSVPVNYGEDDVDTGIHYLFTKILGNYCFEGMCNPPGGDWSGFSIIDDDYENRWLSLPRVSDFVNGKRPDHILEVFGVFDKPLLLSIESKEKSVDLEESVGTRLITYIEKLMEYTPSAKRQIKPTLCDWTWGDSVIEFKKYETLSAAAYLKRYAEDAPVVFKKECEILFVMDPVANKNKIGWEIEIIPSSKRSQKLKEFILTKYAATGDTQFILK